MQQRNAIHTQRLQAFIQRGLGPVTIEKISLHVAVKLRGNDEPLRQPAALSDCCTNACLAAPRPIIARCINKPNLVIKNSIQRSPRAGFIYAITIGIRHIAQGGRAKTNGRNGKRGFGDCDAGVLGHGVLPFDGGVLAHNVSIVICDGLLGWRDRLSGNCLCGSRGGWKWSLPVSLNRSGHHAKLQ